MRKNLPWYQFIRLVAVNFALFFFYKKVEVKGLEKVPKNKPLLLVPNHQNSFMDALVVTVNYKPVTYYLTRAKAFNPPAIGALISSLNMLPVYRVRDGFSSIQKNKEIFERCLDYLAKGSAILIFAEANHDLKRRLRPLSKGFTRIAFDAEIQNNWEFGMHIQPVGVNYGDHRHSRNHVSVVFGDPIPISDFKELYEKDERKAANELKNRTAENMKPLIMHVPKLDQYNVHRLILDELEPKRELIANADLMNERVAIVAKEANEELIQKADNVSEIAEKNDLNIRMAAGLIKSRWNMIVFFPVYLFAFLNNIIPYQPIRNIVDKIEDHAFDASIKLLLGLLVFPIFYVLITLILWLVGVPTLYLLGYLVLSVFTCRFFKSAKDIFKHKKEKQKLKDFATKQPEEYANFVSSLDTFKKLRSSLFPSE